MQNAARKMAIRASPTATPMPTPRPVLSWDEDFSPVLPALVVGGSVLVVFDDDAVEAGMDLGYSVSVASAESDNADEANMPDRSVDADIAEGNSVVVVVVAALLLEGTTVAGSAVEETREVVEENDDEEAGEEAISAAMLVTISTAARGKTADESEQSQSV
jgi:hypothetical protein